MNVTTIGLDLAKSVFQVHGIDAHGKTLITPPGHARTPAPPRSPAQTKAARTGQWPDLNPPAWGTLFRNFWGQFGRY